MPEARETPLDKKFGQYTQYQKETGILYEDHRPHTIRPYPFL